MTKPILDIRRASDLVLIRRAISAAAPELAHGQVGLTEIGALCQRRAASRVGWNWHETRDQILAIACEWDLANDCLEHQPDICLRTIAEFLRGK